MDCQAREIVHSNVQCRRTRPRREPGPCEASKVSHEVLSSDDREKNSCTSSVQSMTLTYSFSGDGLNASFGGPFGEAASFGGDGAAAGFDAETGLLGPLIRTAVTVGSIRWRLGCRREAQDGDGMRVLAVGFQPQQGRSARQKRQARCWGSGRQAETWFCQFTDRTEFHAGGLRENSAHARASLPAFPLPGAVPYR